MNPRRVTLDCRNDPKANCTVTIAGTEQEVLELGLYHARVKHGGKDTPDFRQQLRLWLTPDIALAK